VLTALFGGDGSDDQARRRISNALADLRRQLAPCLLTSWRVLGLRPDVTCTCDVQTFEDYLRGAHEHGDATALRAAAELYRGEFLAGVSLADAPEFEMWLLLHRESYHAQFVETLEGLVASAMRHSAWTDGMWAARRLIELEPWHEDAHRHLMIMLARSGQRTTALAHFEICKRLLRELDAEPAEETVEVYEEIKRTRGDVPNNLPAETTEFIGRDAEIRLLSRQVGERESRLTSIVGPPGSGKTRLATSVAKAVARAERPRFGDGVYVVSHGARGAEALTAAIARTLAFDTDSNTSEPAQLASKLRQLSLLLVLDDLDNSRDTAELVSELVSRAPDLSVLVTAPAPLRVQGEHVLTIGGLEVPARPEHLERSAAGALLLAEARRADLYFSVADSARASLVQLCHLLHGLPLALILAARGLVGSSSANLVDAIEAALTAPARPSGRREPWWESPQWLSVLDTLELLEQPRTSNIDRAASYSGGHAARRTEPFALVCTPDADTRDLVARLRQEGMVVCVTNDLQGSLRVATAVGPDVVFIDPCLPKSLEPLLRAHPTSSRASIHWVGEAVPRSVNGRGDRAPAGVKSQSIFGAVGSGVPG
jgi:DNA-binding SARP family transcriptional activator